MDKLNYVFQKVIITFEKLFLFWLPMNIKKDWTAKLEMVYLFMLIYSKKKNVPLHILCWLLNDFTFVKKLWRIFFQMYNFLLHCFTGEVLSFPINYFSSNRKMPILLCKTLAKLNYDPPPYILHFWINMTLLKNNEEYFLQIHNFLLHFFTGEVSSFPIMVPAWILQLQQKNAQPLVQDPCK